MPNVQLLPGEREEAKLRPHPLSFLPQYTMAGFPLALGIFLAVLYNSESWATFDGGWFLGALFGNAAIAYIYPLVALAVAGAIVAVSAIRWKVFFGYMALGFLTIGIGGAWSSGLTNLSTSYNWAIPLTLIILTIPVIGTTEFYRRSHNYTLTNFRIIFRGGFWTMHERQLKYESITDLDGQQSILGRILNFGTLIPVTQSGFGLGADNSFAMMGASMGGEKAGMQAGFGAAAGGGKDVNVARARSFHQLTGVRPFKKTKYKLETLIQQATSTPYLQQQVELQQQMLGAMQHMASPHPAAYPPVAPTPVPPQHDPSSIQTGFNPRPLAQFATPAHNPYASMAQATPPAPVHPQALPTEFQPPMPSDTPPVAPKKRRRLFGRKEPEQGNELGAGLNIEYEDSDPVFEGRQLR